jgi:FtsH-binding integral membrane protein
MVHYGLQEPFYRHNMLDQPMALNRTETSFMSQVMMFFGLAILVSAGGTYVGFQYLVPLFLSSPAVIWILFAVELILVFTSRMWSAAKPLNYFLFCLFAFITGITLVPLLASILLEYGGPDLIVKALGATTLMFGATAIFGWTTGWNLTGLRGFLVTALIGMIVVSIIGIFLPWGSTFEMIFAGFGIVLFSGYTMYDFQQLKLMPQDRPIDAALRIYLDIFNLFIYILRLMTGSRR